VLPEEGAIALGFDPVSEKDFDRRRFWIEDKLQQSAPKHECSRIIGSFATFSSR